MNRLEAALRSIATELDRGGRSWAIASLARRGRDLPRLFEEELRTSGR